MEPTVDHATGWAEFLQTTGGWGVAIIVGVAFGAAIVVLARKYDKHRNESEEVLRGMIKDQTELLTQNKTLNEQLVALMNKVDSRL